VSILETEAMDYIHQFNRDNHNNFDYSDLVQWIEKGKFIIIIITIINIIITYQ
jgi:hypothetical protein